MSKVIIEDDFYGEYYGEQADQDYYDEEYDPNISQGTYESKSELSPI